ncbi:ribosomal S18 protein [Rutstroemia sp. NJR-2017a BBW]|nr:ribosomal S18 protein [Rutstroemia sp. NJR-2017a BBW]
MPPRLQCLNAVRVTAPRPSLRLCFSTTRAELADAPTPPPLGADSVTRLMAVTKAKETARKMLLREGTLRPQTRQTTVDDIEAHTLRADLSKQISRKWKLGDIYAPHDLSDVEMAKWKKKAKVTHDVFDVIGFNPLEQYKVGHFVYSSSMSGGIYLAVLSEYMTSMGRIKGSKETGLRPVNQRKIAKAIRRSIGMGLMPSVHRHPGILYKMRTRADLYSPYKPGPS